MPRSEFLAFLSEQFPKYFGKIRFPDSSGIGIKPVSREGTERLVRAAIEYAVANKRKSVTFVHKGNIMKFTEGAFRNWGYALAENGVRRPGLHLGPVGAHARPAKGDAAANDEQKEALAAGRVLVKDAIADITLQQVLTRPEDFDVIATMNLNGDYLSDALAAQVGGIGIAPGGNINYVTGHAVFEATHGTAPKYANLDKVNPSSVILSGEMMLRYMGWIEAADLVLAAMDGAIAAKDVTYDFARLMEGATEVKCSEFGDALIRKCVERRAPRPRRCAAARRRGLSRRVDNYRRVLRAITRRAPHASRAATGRDRRPTSSSGSSSTAAVNATGAIRSSSASAIASTIGALGAIKADYPQRIEARADPEFLRPSSTRSPAGSSTPSASIPPIEFFALELDPRPGRRHRDVTERYAIAAPSSPPVRGTPFGLTASGTLPGATSRAVSAGRALAASSRALRKHRRARPLRGSRSSGRSFTSRARVRRRRSCTATAGPCRSRLRSATPLGVLVDAVLLSVADVSILFSFTRSYFHVDLERVSDAVQFLHGILPLKPVSELFTVLGRESKARPSASAEIFRHLERIDDRFVRAPGERGLVMACFTLESADVIFKVIRDRFAPPSRDVARGGHGQVRHGLPPRPRGPAGGRAGVPAHPPSEGALRAGHARRTALPSAPKTCSVEGDDRHRSTMSTSSGR